MQDVVIRVENLGKLYRIGGQERYKALRDTLTEAWVKPFRRMRSWWSGDGAPSAPAADNFIWALKEVSFEVRRGEVIGIIGRNGAGKSTLLKILCRITEPTEGSAEIRGRVGSLLEVGTGFHPELTGRENIYLNGAILGMRKAEIDRKFDEIVAFAEVEKFIDTPVKHFSSGMYVRLAFAVAAHLEPEILLVDEVLAVGDAAFQKKCLGKMGDVAREGRTVLFVSHNMGAVARLCTNGILLDNGKMICSGTSQTVVDRYISGISIPTSSVEFEVTENKTQFLNISLKCNGSETKQFYVGSELELSSMIKVTNEVKRIQWGFIIRQATSDGILHCLSIDSLQDIVVERPGIYRLCAKFPFLRLYPGEYFIDDLWLANVIGETIDLKQHVVKFSISSGGPFISRKLASHVAVVYDNPVWECELVKMD